MPGRGSIEIIKSKDQVIYQASHTKCGQITRDGQESFFVTGSGRAGSRLKIYGAGQGGERAGKGSKSGGLAGYIS